jgi:bromodomain-containing protein 7/9
MPTRKDDYAFFLGPVDLEKVPGYMDVIKQPMDFGTMADKVSRSKYRSLHEFAVRLSHSFGPSISKIF